MQARLGLSGWKHGLRAVALSSRWRHDPGPTISRAGVRVEGVRSCSLKVPLTAEHYQVKRGDFAQVTELDVEEFRRVVGADYVLTSAGDVELYNVDWLRNHRGQSTVVIRPRTTAEVSQVMSHCSRQKLAVVPQGGNTGLVGGSVPVFDEVVISLARMKDVIDLNVEAGVLVCQSGCILESLDNMLSEHELMMPLDLGAKGSCQIGGNAATNAGGIRLLRYGSLRGNILGLEAVLADGTIMDCLATVRKDNTGYDLKQLFIGSEGTLGIITALSILTPPKPMSVNVAFMGCASFEQARRVYSGARAKLGEILSAVEFLDSKCMDLVEKHLGYRRPIQSANFYTLVETSGSSDQHDKEKLTDFLEHLSAEGCIEDGTVANDLTKAKALWAIREEITVALLHEGTVYKYDVSVPQGDMYRLVEDLRERCKDSALCTVGYGHLGDGNLHLNIIGSTHSTQLLSLIEPYIYERTAQVRGSISAEHGLGLKKAGFIHYSKSKEAVNVMQNIKSLLDPQGILNPYKTLPKPLNC